MKTTKLVLVLLGGLLFAAGAFAQAGGPVAISCPTDITMLASGSGGAVVFYTATASGGCQPPPLLVCNPPSGSTFPVGTSPVICIASDTCGQLASCGFKVTVQPPLRRIYLSTGLLPPANGMYISPAQWHALYANGIIISNIVHRRFTQGTLPPGPGISLTHSFGSQVDFDVSLDGGQTFMHESAPAQVTVSLQANATATGVFDTEMLQLDIAGGTLPAGVMIRESPTLASTGQTQVQSAPGGGYRISSFFDIFTEVSLDGGQTWSPSGQPGHMELRLDPTTVPPTAQPTPLLPPPDGQYVSPAQWQALYAQGLVIKDVKHKFFAASLPVWGLPPGQSQTHQFGSLVDFQVSQDGGKTFRPARAPAQVSVNLQGVLAGLVQMFDTEMTQLDVAGGDLPTGVMLRASPTQPSYGGTSLEQASDGTFRVSSFFDIFTELSVDGGQTWQPSSSGPAHVELERVGLISAVPTANLPPLGGQYLSPVQWQASYANGIILSNVVYRNFTESAPPPPPGQSQLETFRSTVDLMVSTDGGKTWVSNTAPASAVLRVSSFLEAGSTRFFDTEMLQMNVTGGTLPKGMMIRESPSKASLGRTSLTQDAAGGPVRVSSFFDIFTELSLDNGLTWTSMVSPADTVAFNPRPTYAPYVLHCPADMTVYALHSYGANVTYPLASGGPPYPDCPFCCFAPTCVPAPGSVFPIGTTTVTCSGVDGCGEHASCSFNITVLPRLRHIPLPANLLPPLNGMYLGPGSGFASYPNGVILSNVLLRGFTQGTPPPAPGASLLDSFGAAVEFDVSLDGGLTFMHHSAPAQVTVRLKSDSAGGDLYDTEMTQLDLTDSALPTVLKLRESPTLASIGRTQVQSAPGGGFLISSFFDIFTEVSLDGGQTWVPSGQPGHVELRVDPSTVPPTAQPTPLLPPPDGQYVSSAQWQALYAQGIVLKDVKHKFFTDSLSPRGLAPGESQTHQFGSLVDFKVSLDGGKTFQAMRAPARVSVNLQSVLGGSVLMFDTEMTQLDVAGGDLPTGVMLRASPTQPSYGGTSLEQASDGTFRVSSFFDIFTELSVDGGKTWQPSSSGPAHVQLERMGSEEPVATPNLPPSVGEYVSSDDWEARYANGILISRVVHRSFTQNRPPPPPGATQLEEFGSMVDLMVSTDGGQTWTSNTAPASGVSRVSSILEAGNTRFFDTEMLQLNITGGTLPAGMMIRESPSKASLGRASLRQDAAGGPLRVSSFFDIFTELSLDRGQTWSPALTPGGTVHFTEAPLRVLCPSDMTAFTPDSAGAVVTYLVLIGIGDCPILPGPTVACDPPSGSTFPVGVTTVTCTGSDGCGEHPTCSFNVTVNWLPFLVPPEYAFARNLLPPLDGQYASDSTWSGSYGNGVIISNVVVGWFTQGFPPPPTGAPQSDSFSGVATVDVSTDGGKTFGHYAAPANLSVLISPAANTGGTQTYGTEMLALDISGGTLPAGVRLRESPSKASLGRTTVRQDPASGQFLISSFFDIFTELSLDSAQTWSPLGSSPASVVLRPRLPFAPFTLHCPADLTVYTFTSSGDTVTYPLPTDGPPFPDCPLCCNTINCVPPSGSLFPAGTTAVNCSGVNGCGEHATCSFNVTVDVLPIAFAPEFPFAQSLLPPPNGQLEGDSKWVGRFENGMVLSNVLLRRFTQSFSPPVPGAPQTDSFSAVAEMDVSTDGGTTFMHYLAPASVLVRSALSGDSGGTQTYDTEMLTLDLSGGTLPAGIMVRESPSKASLGRTTVRQDAASGQFLISSFFDIFTELSLDGGQTWSALSSGLVPVALQPGPHYAPYVLHCPADMTVYTISSSGAKVSYAVPTAGPPFPDCPFCCYAATCNPPPGSTFPLGTTTVTCSGSDGCGEHPTCSFNVTVAWRKHFFAGPNLPPLNGVYLSPVPWIGSYPKGILISNLIHRRFTQNFPPPPPGVMETHSFGSQVSFQLSTDGGRTFIQQSAMAQATVSLRADPTAPDLFDTEMTQLDITGGTLPAVMRIRESPTRASTGQTQVQPVPGGFMVSSFFDVFTEISLDGGQTWLPSDQPAPLELHTDPGYTPTALADFRLEDGQPKVTVMTQVGLRYTLLSKNNLDDPNWTPLSSISGNGQSVDLTDKAPGAVVRRFYRVLIEEDTGSATPSPQ